MSSSIIKSDNGVASGVTGIVQTAGSDGTLQLQTTSSGGTATTAVTIDTSQNVGIGTSSPVSASKLTVSGSISVNGSDNNFSAGGNRALLDLTTPGGTNYVRFGGCAGGASTPVGIAFQIGPASGGCSEVARITTGGNLSILGTDTSATLYVQNIGSGPSCPSVGILGQPQAGFYVRRQATSDTNTNATFCIGVDDTSGAGGQPNLIVGLNTSGVGALPRNITNGVKLAYNATAWASNSDARLKDVTSVITDGLEALSKINPVKFTWKADAEKTPCVGVIAQDVQQVIPEAVAIGNNETGHLTVKYTELIPHLISAVKELQSQIIELKQQLGAK
jgi:Chaperone of endosialidase